MRYFRVRNLRKYQKYTDRKPKWICVYLDMRACMDLDAIKAGVPSPTDADMWHAVSIFMLAASFDDPSHAGGHPPLPMDPVWVKRAAGLDRSPNLDKLLALGLLQEAPEPVTNLGVSVTHRTGQDRTGHDKRQDSSSAPSADPSAWIDELKSKADGTPPAIVDAYAAACLRACAEYHDRTGGSFTAKRMATMTRRMGKCSFAAQMAAIEVYVDREAGAKDFRYLCGIADRMNRLSPKELDRDMDKHRARMSGAGLLAEVNDA